MMLRHTALVALSVFGLAVAHAEAQDSTYYSFAGTATAQAPGSEIGAGPPFGVIALDPVNVGRAVLNAPYSAEAVTEVTQMLSDGNRIERRTSATVARDASGRTRREQHAVGLGSFVASNDQPIVTITDPTAGVHITLNYELKVAFRSKPISVKYNETDVTASGPVAFGSGEPLTSRTTAGPTGATRGVDVRPLERQPFDAPVFEPGVPATIVGAAVARRFNGSVHTDTLEPRSIEGLRAEGTRTTMTIPAGAMGNTLPIEVVSEQWYSPELGIVLQTRRSDPRFGETVYRLNNIDRNEPAPDLFKVPSDFRIEDMRPRAVRPLRPEGQ